MKRKIRIIGLGIMGAGIAGNFLKNGHPVFLWNRTAERLEKFRGTSGAVLCETPGKVCENSEIVFEITADDSSSRSVWLGEKGILSGANYGKILVASSTLSAGWTDELSELCKRKEVDFLDMPLTGGRMGAETGKLTLLCGGEENVLDSIRPDLSAISGKISYFGKAGSGMRYKLILNFLQAVHMSGFNQAMELAKKEGLDLEKVADALRDRPGGTITGIAAKSYFESEPALTFSVEWISKDLSYCRELAGQGGASLLDAVMKEYGLASEAGLLKNDWSIVSRKSGEMGKKL